MALRRIQSELIQIQQDVDGINQSTGGSMYIFPTNGDVFEMQCVLKGPDGSPYHGGVFVLDISLPPDYPMKAPKITFQTPVWHPNVDFATGRVGLFTMGQDQWNVQWTLQSLMLMLYSAMKDPVLEEQAVGMNIQASIEYREEPQEYINTAQLYTQRYAGSESELAAKQRTLQRLTQMGFDETMAREALIRTSWNEDAAVTDLLTLLAGDEPSAADSSYSFVQEFSQLEVTNNEGSGGSGWVDISSGGASGTTANTTMNTNS